MEKTPIPLTRSTLSRIRVRAIRRGIWFRVLDRLERASIDLTIRVVEKVRSTILKRMLTSIMKKLSNAMESKVSQMIRQVGETLAQKVSKIAQTWGNKSAVEWKADPGFIRYLSVMCLNASPMFSE